MMLLLLPLLLAGLRPNVASSPAPCVRTVLAELRMEALTDRQTVIELGDVRLVETVAMHGSIGAYHLDYAADDSEPWRRYLADDGQTMIFRSASTGDVNGSLTVFRADFSARRLRIRPIHFLFKGAELHVQVAGCLHQPSVLHLDGGAYGVFSPSSVGLVAQYYNELSVQFRTVSDAVLFASIAQGDGDVLLAQVHRGVLQVFFDFGSRSWSLVSGGVALDDGQWHDFRWSHQFDQVLLFVDGVHVDQTTPADLYRKLDLDSKIFVGGLPQKTAYPMSSLSVSANLTGCLRNAHFNHIDLLSVAAPQGSGYGPKCPLGHPEQFTLIEEDTVVQSMALTAKTVTVQFRTFVADAADVLSLMDASNALIVNVAIRNHHPVLSIASIDYVPDVRNESRVSDGAWHELRLTMSDQMLTVFIDGLRSTWMEGAAVSETVARVRSFRLGGRRFIGCYRALALDGVPANLRKSMHFPATGVIFDACLLHSGCLRNPCENGGQCSQRGLDGYNCTCTEHFTGATCHRSLLDHSCEEHLSGSDVASEATMIDVDGGGPLAPMRVVCRREFRRNEEGLRKEITTTELAHDSGTIEVAGFPDAGGLFRLLDYGAEAAELDALVTGFDECAQSMTYSCRGGATLMSFEGSPHRPSSWYVGRNGHHGLQWGGAQLQSRMCSCALNDTCIDGGRCNCDSGKTAVDSGENTHLSILPVKELFLGGTDSNGRSASVTIGSLRCRNRISFLPATFLDRDASLSGELRSSKPAFDMSLQMRTTQRDGTLVHSESADSDDWLTVYFKDDRLFGQVVIAGRMSQISLKSQSLSDDSWHRVYFEVSQRGLVLAVDGRSLVQDQFVIPTSTLRRWRLGSPSAIGGGGAGFAGVLRSVYINGEEQRLPDLVQQSDQQSIVVGERGQCAHSPCDNDGVCIEQYNSFSCNCTATAFSGPYCSDDVGLTFPGGVHLRHSLHPANKGDVFRVGFQTHLAPTVVLSASGLFTDATLNLTLSDDGGLLLAIFDGKESHWTIRDKDRRFNDGQFYDVRFSFRESQLKFQINGYQPVRLTAASWQFLQDLNVWNVGDDTFIGCLSRLQIGRSFPLRLPLGSARLSVLPSSPSSPSVSSAACPTLAYTSWSSRLDQRRPENIVPLKPQPLNEVSVNVRPSVERRRPMLASYLPLVGLCVLLLLLFCALLWCYVRSKPDGVYKTNEDAVRFATPSRSDEPLVLHAHEKEYFC